MDGNGFFVNIKINITIYILFVSITSNFSEPIQNNVAMYDSYVKQIFALDGSIDSIRLLDELSDPILARMPYFIPHLMNDIKNIKISNILKWHGIAESKYSLEYLALKSAGINPLWLDRGSFNTPYATNFELRGVPTANDITPNHIKQLEWWWENYEELIRENTLTKYKVEFSAQLKLSEMTFSGEKLMLLRVAKSEGISILPALINAIAASDNGVLFGLFWSILLIQMQNGIQPNNPFDYESKFWEHPESLPDEKWRLDVVVRWWDKHSSNYDTLPVLKSAIEKEMVGIKARLEKLKAEAI